MISTSTAYKRITAMGFYVFNHLYLDGDGAIVKVSAENGDDAADYYGEFRGGYPWINPQLETLAKNAGCYWEWYNPGCIALYEK